MMETILYGFYWSFIIVGILGVVSIVLLPAGVIIGAVLISKEKDEIKKKAKIRKGIICGVIPFALVMIGLLGSVIAQVLKVLLNK